MKYFVFTLSLFFCTMSYSQESVSVSNISEFNAAIKKAVPGTTIWIRNGEWRDVHLQVTGIGKKDQPITIKAETPGKVIITGDSRMSIYGKYLVVDGLWFKDGSPTSKSIISFRKNSKEFAFNSRLTNCTISYFNPENASFKSHWVDIWGNNNRVDHNNFTGKTNDGTTLVVWLKGVVHEENNHRIDHNFFGHRPELGKNGGETIRIGTSAYSMKSSKTIVENNTFKNCDGEIEIISNKSGDNIYRNNLFFSSKGTLTLRHGNNALVENNVFLGNNVPKTGGIRIINEGHIVRNNLLIGLKGTGFRGPIVVMNGVPNSPLNRYHQVKNVNVQNNTILNCGPIVFGAGKDAERTLPPIETIFGNNLVSNTNSENIVDIEDSLTGISFTNNVADSNGTFDEKLFKRVKINWKLVRSLPMPTLENPDLISSFKNDQSPTVDITNNPKKNNTIGAFNLNNGLYPEALRIKTGTTWKPLIVKPKVVQKVVEIEVAPGVGTLSKALKKVGRKGVLRLVDGIYYMNKTQKISGSISIEGSANSRIKASDAISKPLNYFFRIQEKSRLKLRNLVFDGDHKNPVKYAIVSPDKQQPDPYNLFIDQCVFQNFTNTKGGSIFKAYIGTMADTIKITNSTFKDSYRGLNLSYEKEFARFSAHQLIVHNSTFKNLTEFAINYTKAGNIYVSNGGKLSVTNSVFSKVGNSEKGFAIKSKGIPEVTIANSVFVNSYSQKHPVALYGPNSLIENCLIHNSGKVKLSKAARERNILYRNPKWLDKKKFVPSEKSYLLGKNNKVGRIGLQDR
ncbi:chondroitinase-B domain-containing protein [Flavobacteriaceae bacterium S356]|uniref:Chondroitinase-B domain-containing protein n=1 Tax=Asprobacillus argus TaxID=3076534 RepID=A0ABU3LCK8_9FLAO|nr:chondroitinase-B domain-containing protein [Flavobacteriaceae bacterium S356]